MKKKLTPVLILIAVLVVIAAMWQAYEAATLENKLLEIDKRAQTERLLAVSLPEVEKELQTLLQAESDKMGRHLPFETTTPPLPSGGKADFNRGYFLHAEHRLQILQAVLCYRLPPSR